MTTCPCRKASLRVRTFNFALREEPPLFPVRLKLGLHPRPFQNFTIDDMRGYFASEHRKRSEEHTSELQSPCNLVCRLLLEKKKTLSKHRSISPETPTRSPHRHRAPVQHSNRMAASIKRHSKAYEYDCPSRRIHSVHGRSEF